jgi:germination protein M
MIGTIRREHMMRLTTGPGARTRRCATGIAIVTLGGILAGCGGSAKSSSPTSTSSTAPTTPSSTRATSTTSAPAPTIVDAYFVRAQKLAAAGRSVPAPATPDAALRALMSGPRAGVEQDLGFTSNIPAGTTLNRVILTGDVATVDVSRSFATGGGSQSMQARVAQVVFTATQFPGIERVRFRLDGTAVTSIGGEGVMVDGVGRDAFANVTPAILVESPTPGETVGSTVHVRGIARTFEQTVNYTLTGPDGVVSKEGFTTAAGAKATGSWGSFAFDVAFTTTRGGSAELNVHQLSSENGSHTDIVSIPLQVRP